MPGISKAAAGGSDSIVIDARNTNALANDVSRLYNSGKFGRTLFDAAQALGKKTRDLSLRAIAKNPKHLENLSIVAELYDYQGKTRQGQKVLVGAETVLEELRKTRKAATKRALELAHQRARLIANYARLKFYRNRQYQKARDLFEECYAILGRLSPQHEPPYQRTVIQILYYLGSTLRQLGEYEAADKRFVEAIELLRESASHAQEPTSVGLPWTVHQMAIVLGIGSGWMNYTRGKLDKALANVTPAQAMLAQTGDEVHKAYLQLIRGSILRCQAGLNDRLALTPAIECIEAAYETFTSDTYGHKVYATRAALERAQCALATRDTTTASEWIEQAEKLAGNNTRWLSHVALIRSRICRHKDDFEGALRWAEKAEEFMSDHDEPLGDIDSFIAQAEALIRRGNYHRARQKLEEAQTKSMTKANSVISPKIKTVLLIHMADSYAREGDIGNASRYLTDAFEVGKDVEHKTVSDMAEEVRRRLGELKRDFVIPWTPADTKLDLTFETHLKELRKWLIERAQAEPWSRSEQAEQLGVCRATLANWHKEALNAKR